VVGLLLIVAVITQPEGAAGVLQHQLKTLARLVRRRSGPPAPVAVVGVGLDDAVMAGARKERVSR